MKIGSGTQPDLCGSKLDKVPEKEVATVTSAINMVGKVANNPERYPKCHSFFAENCPGGKKESLQETFNKVSVWKKPPDKNETAGASVCMSDTSVMAYSYVGYAAGAEALASYFMHELMHNCGLSDDDKHKLADRARLYCMGGGDNSFSLGVGKLDSKYLLALSYRRFLTEWRSGKLQPYAGLSANFLLDFDKGENSQLHAGGVVGIRNRTNLLWGGERFGGLTLGADAGIGYGRFKEMSAGEANKFGWETGLILQLHAGVEFAIPGAANGRERAMSLEINYSRIKPLTGDAQNIQSLTLGISKPF